MASPGIDAEKPDVLRRWAAGLEHDGRVEVAAAGRAILLLIEEIERLHVVVWDKQLYPEVPPQDFANGAGASSRPRLFEMLRDQLQRRSADMSPQAEWASEDAFRG